MIDHKKPITKLIKKNAIKKEIEINKKKSCVNPLLKNTLKRVGKVM
jgi:hypothetical protein